MSASTRVLLIEDNEQNRYLAAFLLERHGYRVVQAVDGPSGIAAARALVPDLILLDIQLPGMSGYDVARALRSIESLDRTPIVAVTSYAMHGDRERALESGCNGYIEKPINPETFIADVERVRDSVRGV
jgi:two-component system cell cycle response regulator DivK